MLSWRKEGRRGRKETRRKGKEVNNKRRREGRRIGANRGKREVAEEKISEGGVKKKGKE